jgi:hypothetical protein
MRMSEDKVQIKDSCWSVRTIYDPRELPGVSTFGPGIGRGVIVRIEIDFLIMFSLMLVRLLLEMHPHVRLLELALFISKFVMTVLRNLSMPVLFQN